MPGTLTPPFSPDDEFCISAGEGHQVIWFLDYADRSTRRMRDVLLRTIDRFRSVDLAFAVRFLPADTSATPADAGPSELAARAAIAAGAQGRFNDMHERLFNDGPDFTRDALRRIARDIGLDAERFEADLFSAATSDRLNRDIASASRSASVPHTPMLFIDGRFYEGAWDDTSILEALERPLGVRLELANATFQQWAASAGLVLVLATLAALILVNLGGAVLYENLRDTVAGVSFDDWSFRLTLEIWINDGLMALFFLIVGIEIKRELIDGELSDPASAALPLIGAVGGMLVPAAVFVAFNWGRDSVVGWGVPMATDIAFTLGILALLGDRVPASLKVFVSALAIADDLGAILVIALFYGHGFDLQALGIAAVIFAAMIGLNVVRVYSRVPYLILGAFLWYFTHQSGLHATLAGVLTAIAIPSRPSAQIQGVALQANMIFDYELRDPEQLPEPRSIHRLQAIVDRLRDPGFHLQHALESWTYFLILPLFAFFNTGILLFGGGFSLFQPEVLGTVLGLVVGKPLGIVLFVFVAVRLGWARLSSEIGWAQILGAGLLCGIGFTMSIFIASAAFADAQLQSVKLAVLLASTIAAGVGTIVLHRAGKQPE